MCKANTPRLGRKHRPRHHKDRYGSEQCGRCREHAAIHLDTIQGDPRPNVPQIVQEGVARFPLHRLHGPPIDRVGTQSILAARRRTTHCVHSPSLSNRLSPPPKISWRASPRRRNATAVYNA
eukprot:scaffold1318_cov388-Prasinococcus_capsulatus_cf.AAC.59